MNITMRLLEVRDIPLMVAFLPDEDRRTRRQQIYKRYLEEQSKGERLPGVCDNNMAS